MKNTTISSLVLYTALSCGVPEEVTPPYRPGSEMSATGTGGAGQGGDSAGAFGGMGGDSVGGLGGSHQTGGSDDMGGSGGSGGDAGAAGNGGAGGSCGDLLGQFTTYSQGGWHNSQAASLSTLLNPNGVMIGDGSTDYALFTTANAVTIFLPAGGTPAALQGQYINPASTPAGVLAGQTLALKLNILASPQEVCGYSLSDLVVVDGPCENKSVSDVVSLADQALAGMTVPLSYLDISKCAEGINLNFEKGSVDNQYLKIP